MGGTGTHKRAPRGDIRGWTAATARRQRNWLWTVDPESLDGHGYAVTLTVRDTPETAADFDRLRRAYLKRLARMGAVRTHWVIEWQARGTPHIHAAVYAREELTREQRNMLVGHWLAVSGDYASELSGQDMKRIDGPLGWLKYLAKHASRGAAHYQRSGHPDGWDKTGRLWGHTGDWPTVEPIELADLSNPEFWRVRRLMRAWSIADARKAGDWSRVRYLRRAPSAGDRSRSSYQGVSEWIPEDVMLRLVDLFERENR